MTDAYRARRGEANDASKLHAARDGQSWGRTESEILLDWDGSEAELDLIAELIERTREACRQRFYEYTRGDRPLPQSDEVTKQATGTVRHTTRTVTSTVTTTEWSYTNWPEEDRSPWYR